MKSLNIEYRDRFQIRNPSLFLLCINNICIYDFHNLKQLVIFADSVELFHIVLHFFTEEFRHLNGTVTFRRFRVSDDVPATDTLIGFADR